MERVIPQIINIWHLNRGLNVFPVCVFTHKKRSFIQILYNFKNQLFFYPKWFWGWFWLTWCHVSRPTWCHVNYERIRVCLDAGHKSPRHVWRRHEMWRGKSTPRVWRVLHCVCTRIVVADIIYSWTKQLPRFSVAHHTYLWRLVACIQAGHKLDWGT